MDRSGKFLRALYTLLILAGLTACLVTPLPPAPAATAQSPTPNGTPLAPLPVAASPASQTPAPAANRIAAAIQLSNPSGMAVGGGYLWVVSGGSVVRVDPKTNRLVGKPIAAGAQFESAVAFGEGALWVTVIGLGDLGAPSDTDAVLRFDPETGEPLGRIKLGRGPVSLALTPATAWVTNFGMGGETVTRIDARTTRFAGEPVKTGRAPLSIAVGDGSVWVANHDARTVTRIDPLSGQVVANISLSSEPHRIAFGEGAVWIAHWHDNSVSRIDPQTNREVGEPIAIGHRAGNLAAAFGSVWVTSDYRPEGDAKDTVVVRIDVQRGRAVETIPVGGHPIDVTVTEDAVWVSVQNPDRLLRLTPR